MARNTCPLLTSIRKAILPQNNSLPSSVACIWLTPLELHARLLMAGVSKRLTLCMLTDALKHNNKTEAYMTKREHNKVMYYRSTIAHMKDNTNNVPIRQRCCGKSTGRVEGLKQMQHMNTLCTTKIATFERLTMHWRHLIGKQRMKSLRRRREVKERRVSENAVTLHIYYYSTNIILTRSHVLRKIRLL